MQRIGIIFQMKESDMLSALGKRHWTAAKVMHLLARRMLFPLVCGVVQLSTLHPPAHSDEACSVPRKLFGPAYKRHRAGFRLALLATHLFVHASCVRWTE